VSGVGALAFTSVNGVEAFAARSAWRETRVFAVGAATAAAARAAGFADIVSSEGGVTALAGGDRAGATLSAPSCIRRPRRWRASFCPTAFRSGQ
jgi:uroporphyrinogen-III synthase